MFDVIGTSFGTPSVSTKFKVPNIVNKTIIGADRNIKALGGTGGSETVQLTRANMPVHNHNVTLDSQGAHTHTGSTDSKGEHSHSGRTTEGDGSHGHTVETNSGTTGDNNKIGWSGTSNWKGSSTTNVSGGVHIHNLRTNTEGAHTHSVTVLSNGAHTHTATVGNSGEGTAFSVVPPYIALNYIIKYDDPSNITEPVENYRMEYYLGVF